MAGGQSGGGSPPAANELVDSVAASRRMVAPIWNSFFTTQLLEVDLRRRMDLKWTRTTASRKVSRVPET